MSDDLASRLREQGLRLTPQRELILRAVEELRHATPDATGQSLTSAPAAA